MKLVNRCFCLLMAWLGAQGAWGQVSRCASPNPPPCTFIAVDAGSGQPVASFCVGQPVRFELCPGDPTPTNLLFYGVLPGINADYFSAGCSPPNKLPYTYTPQPADVGKVTVSELINDGTSRYYIRVFDVYGTPPPAFTVARCPGNSVSVTVTDATYDSYDVAGQAIPRNVPTPVVLPAGAATLALTGHYAGNVRCTGANTLPVPPALAPAQTPLFTTLTLQGALPSGPATFAFNLLTAGYLFTLQRADATAPGGYRDVAGVPAGSTGFSLPNPPAGCYRVARQDACGGSFAATAPLCTLGLSGNSAFNRNQLLLTTDAGPGATYAVARNGQPLLTYSGTPPGPLEDADVQCGTTYTYRVTATQPGGVSVSNEVAVRTQSSLAPPRPQLLASFNLNNVVLLSPLLAAPLTVGSSLRYRRSGAGPPAADLATTATARPARDSTALAELLAHPPCYTVQLTDVCGNVSTESASTCPALLAATPLDPEGSTVALAWTAFTGPDPGLAATYALQRLAADGAVLASLPVGGGRYADLLPPPDRQILRYRLQIGGAGLPAGTFSYSNVTTVTRELFLALPTAFTPNGDGLNDVLEVKGRYLRGYTLVVVDRNGQEVFRGTQRSEAWDGTIRGHAPVLGTYAWRFQQNGEDGRPFSATGSVTILK